MVPCNVRALLPDCGLSRDHSAVISTAMSLQFKHLRFLLHLLLILLLKRNLKIPRRL